MSDAHTAYERRWSSLSPPGSGANRDTSLESEGVVRHAVTMTTPDGVTLAADLRWPADGERPFPALVISPPGPAAVKDQSVVTNYSRGFTEAGYVTLAADPRNFGQSGGSPRQHFDPRQRLVDMQVAVSYLTSLTDLVDPERIGAVGASAGGTMALLLAGFDPCVKAFVSVCGGFFSRQSLREAMGWEAFETERARWQAAKERFHLRGELDYLPVVTPDGQGAFLTGIEPSPTEPFDYYGTERGRSDLFENRVTFLSRQAMSEIDCFEAADFVGPRAGLFFAGTADVYVPLEGTRQAVERVGGASDLVLLEGANHIDLYDNDRYVAEALRTSVDWLDEHLV